MKNKVFIIAEAGSNWRVGNPDRDLKMAKALIDVASESGADAVKFQTYKPDTVYVPNAGDSNYLSKMGIKESIIDIFKDLSMPYEMIPKLAAYCAEKGIEFMSTPFSVSDAKALNSYVKRFKIASYEISHIRLIEYIAKTGKPLILSTGAATYDDIDWAINHFYESGGKDVTLLQCTAKYPAPLSTLNINAIPNLMKKFSVKAGLSDHSRNPIIGPVSAVSVGASIIEKHFTLHNKLPGADNPFAITPEELKAMINAIRNTEEAIGSGEKEVQPEETELREYAQRAIQAIKDIKKGDILSEGINIDILRPGNQKKGLHPKHLTQIEGKKAVHDIPLGSGILGDCYE